MNLNINSFLDRLEMHGLNPEKRNGGYKTASRKMDVFSECIIKIAGKSKGISSIIKSMVLKRKFGPDRGGLQKRLDTIRSGANYLKRNVRIVS